MKKSLSKRAKLSGPVSIVAHQLKNPIAVLNGCLEVLMGEEIGKINEKQKEYLLDVKENVKGMNRVVNDILDISKIEGGKYLLKPEPTNSGKILRSVISDLSYLTKASNSEIIIEEAKDLPLAFADPVKIRYVIENLISNSIKYKLAGPGRIEIKLKKKDKKILFSCKDNGIGIPEKDFKKVFTKFFRSEEAISIDPSSTGLGLHISKAIISLSNGKIWFKKNKDKGMTFYFTLPIASS